MEYNYGLFDKVIAMSSKSLNMSLALIDFLTPSDS